MAHMDAIISMYRTLIHTFGAGCLALAKCSSKAIFSFMVNVIPGTN